MWVENTQLGENQNMSCFPWFLWTNQDFMDCHTQASFSRKKPDFFLWKKHLYESLWPTITSNSMKHTFLGGGFNYLLFSPLKLGKMNPFWQTYFSDGLELNHQPDFPRILSESPGETYIHLYPSRTRRNERACRSGCHSFHNFTRLKVGFGKLGLGVDGMNGKDPNKVGGRFLFCFVSLFGWLVGWLVVWLFVCLFVCLFLAWGDMNKDKTEVKGVAQYVTGWLIQSGWCET